MTVQMPRGPYIPKFGNMVTHASAFLFHLIPRWRTSRKSRRTSVKLSAVPAANPAGPRPMRRPRTRLGMPPRSSTCITTSGSTRQRLVMATTFRALYTAAVLVPSHRTARRASSKAGSMSIRSIGRCVADLLFSPSWDATPAV